ncbi:MAG: 50S ribosomal protein L31 [Balneolaceae bacterium]
MKKGIHPDYKEIKVIMSDGTEFTTRSTMDTKEGVFKSEVDSKNHPFYNENQKIQKKAGQIDRFNRRYGKKD